MTLSQKVQRLQFEVAKLRKALLTFGKHTNTCSGWSEAGPRDPREMIKENCDCGLQDALSGGDK